MHELCVTGLDLDKNTMVEVYEKFGLEPGTQDFIGKRKESTLDGNIV